MLDIRIRPIRHDTPQELAAPMFKAKTEAMLLAAVAAVPRYDYAEVATVLEHETLPRPPFGKKTNAVANANILYTLTARFSHTVRIYRLAATVALIDWDRNTEKSREVDERTNLTVEDIWKFTESQTTKRRARLALVLLGEIKFDHLETRHERAAFALRALVHRQYGRLQ